MICIQTIENRLKWKISWDAYHPLIDLLLNTSEFVQLNVSTSIYIVLQKELVANLHRQLNTQLLQCNTETIDINRIPLRYSFTQHLLASWCHLESWSDRIYRRNCTRSATIGPTIRTRYGTGLLAISHCRRRIRIHSWIHRRRWIRIPRRVHRRRRIRVHWWVQGSGLRTSISKRNDLASINYFLYALSQTHFGIVAGNTDTILHIPKKKIPWKYQSRHWCSMASCNVDN